MTLKNTTEYRKWLNNPSFPRSRRWSACPSPSASRSDCPRRCRSGPPAPLRTRTLPAVQLQLSQSTVCVSCPVSSFAFCRLSAHKKARQITAPGQIHHAGKGQSFPPLPVCQRIPWPALTSFKPFSPVFLNYLRFSSIISNYTGRNYGLQVEINRIH